MTEKPDNPNADVPGNNIDPERTNDLRDAAEKALQMDAAQTETPEDSATSDDAQTQEGGLSPAVSDTTFDLRDYAREALRMISEQDEEVLQDAEQRASSAVQGTATDAIFTTTHQLQFVVADSPQKVSVAPLPEMIVGRGDKLTNFVPEIDLTELEAYRMGLSRRHAVIYHKKDRLYLKDLNSRNGTSVNGLRLEGEELRMLRHGDAIQLGNLKMHVHFIRVE